MSGPGSIKSIDTGRSKLRFQLAGILVALAMVLLFTAVKFQSKEFLTSSASETRQDRNYTEMWFDSSEMLVGASLQGSQLTVTPWSAGSSAAPMRFEIGQAERPGQTPLWAMASDLSRLAWISNGKLYCRPLSGGKETGTVVTAALPPGQPALSLDVLSDGSIVAVFTNGTVLRFDPTTGQSLGSRRLEIGEVDQAVTDGDYLAVASAKANRLMLYRFRPGQDWMLAEESPAPDPPFRLVIPAPGVMATFTAGGLRVGGTTKNTPGALRAAVSHLSDLIISGDFEKTYVIPSDPERDRYLLADAAPNSTLAVSRSFIAISGPNGTTVLKLGKENRLTSSGRSLSWGSAVSFFLAILLCFGPFLLAKALELLRLLMHGKKESESMDIPRTLGPPPLELVTNFAAGQGAVWAGAGLSAQSGLPVREAFITSIFQAAVVENWTDPTLSKKLQGMCARGHFEEALNEMVAARPTLRSELIANYRAIFCKFAVPSRCHDILTRIPFAAAVTTNYDNLIERVGEVPSGQVLTLTTERPLQPGAPFLLKLYGEMSLPPTVLLSRAEFAAALPRSAMAGTLRSILQDRAVLFLGCSLEGLLHDLTVIGAPVKQRHFVATGVSGAHWKRHAAELTERFGVQVLPCAEDTIRAALPAFLDALMREIERVQGTRPSEVVAAATQRET